MIEVGLDNSYGHPKQDVVSRLVKQDCSIYTTMTNGNIVFISDGENFKIYTDEGGNYDLKTEEAA